MTTESQGSEPVVTESLRAQAMAPGKDPTPDAPYPGEIEDFKPSPAADRGDDFNSQDELVKRVTQSEEPETKDEVTEPEVEADAKQVTEELEAKDPVAKDPVAKEQKIPKSRFDKVNEKYKAAKARVEELEAEKKAETEGVMGTYDFDAKETEYLELVLDGKTAEAAALRKEIRAADRAQLEAEIDARSQQNVNKTNIASTLDEMSDDYAKEFPGFDPESDQYDADAIDEVKALYTGYLAQSKNPLAAFEKAVEAVIKLRDWGREEAPVVEPEAPAAPPKTKPSSEQVRKKVELAGKQPPVISDKGAGLPKPGAERISVTDMSDAEYEALPPATKARLRGDYV